MAGEKFICIDTLHHHYDNFCQKINGKVTKEVFDIITNIILDESNQWKLVRGLDLYTEKPVKFKKAICSFIFLFFPMLKFFSCRSKIFQNGSLGTKNGPSDPLKFLVSLEISKLGPLAHF